MRVEITRTAFCPFCFKEQRPQAGELFLAKGKGKTSFIVHEVEVLVRSRDYGYTPHLFILNKLEGDKIFATQTCLMMGCGVTYKYNNQNKPEIIFTRYTGIALSIIDWNTLVSRSDYGFRLD